MEGVWGLIWETHQQCRCSWRWPLTGITLGPLDATCSDLTDLGSEFLGLGLTRRWGWLKTPPVGDTNVRPG